MKKSSFKNSWFIEIFPYYQFDDLFPFDENFNRLPAKDYYKKDKFEEIIKKSQLFII